MSKYDIDVVYGDVREAFRTAISEALRDIGMTDVGQRGRLIGQILKDIDEAILPPPPEPKHYYVPGTYHMIANVAGYVRSKGIFAVVHSHDLATECDGNCPMYNAPNEDE